MLLTWWSRKGLDTPALINTFDQKLPDQFHLFIPCKLSFYSKPSCYVAVTVCVPAAPPSPSVAWQPAGRAWRPAATAPCCAAPAGPGCSWATLPPPRRSAPCWRSDLQMERWDSAAGHRYGAQTGPKKLFKRKKKPWNLKTSFKFQIFFVSFQLLSVSKLFSASIVFLFLNKLRGAGMTEAHCSTVTPSGAENVCTTPEIRSSGDKIMEVNGDYGVQPKKGASNKLWESQPETLAVNQKILHGQIKVYVLQITLSLHQTKINDFNKKQ